MEINEILKSSWHVRRDVAGDLNTPVDILVELSKDNDSDVRASVAGNLNTPADTLIELSKDDSWCVRTSVAGNPNTPVDTLIELSKDGNYDVRASVAGNPKNLGYTPIDSKFIITDTYVAINGTNHLWSKYKCPNGTLFYICGCFRGSREQLVSRICSTDNLSAHPAVRMRILDALDRKFEEVFGK